MDFDIENQLKQQTVDLNIDDDFKELEDELKKEKKGEGNDSDDELDKLENDIGSNDDFEDDDDKNDNKKNEEMDEDDKLLAEMENNVDENELDENEEENNENEKKENKIENENNNNQSNKNSNDSIKRTNQIKTNEVNPSTKKIDENEQEKAKKINDNSNILPDTKEFIKFSSDLVKKYSTLKLTLPINDNKNKIDIFIENSDKFYCKFEFMKGLSVILYEIKYVEEILNYKNKNKFKDVDYWKTKKENLQNSLKQSFNNIKNGKVTGQSYELRIQNEIKYINKIGIKLKDDKNLNPFETKMYFTRIKKRLELLNNEKSALKNIVENEKKDVEKKKKKKKKKREKKKKKK